MIAEILSNAGFEWIAVDIEHTPIDLNEVLTVISAIQSRGMAAFVRVSANEEVVIKRVLDAGADGVIVPMIGTAEEAKKSREFREVPSNREKGIRFK